MPATWTEQPKSVSSPTSSAFYLLIGDGFKLLIGDSFKLLIQAGSSTPSVWTEQPKS